jgi:ribosome-associated heat shock protein Hsp15
MSEKCRLDVWLWRARFFKTRALAAAHVGAAGVWIRRAGAMRRIDKAGDTVGAGDEMTFTAHRQAVSLRVLDIGARRGPASEARALYALLDDAEEGGHVSGA